MALRHYTKRGSNESPWPENYAPYIGKYSFLYVYILIVECPKHKRAHFFNSIDETPASATNDSPKKLTKNAGTLTCN